MNQTDADSLFEKRFNAYFIDQLFCIFIIVFSTSFTSVNKDLTMLWSFVITIILPLVLYFNILPLFTDGKTLGLYMMKLKLIHYKNRNILMKFIFSLFRSFYSILTLYIFRVLTINNMNNLGQLNFDKRFDMSIIKEDFKLNLELEEVNYRVCGDLLTSIKYFAGGFFILFLVAIILDFVQEYISMEVFLGIIVIAVFLLLVFKNKDFKNQINSRNFATKGDVEGSSSDSTGDGD